MSILIWEELIKTIESGEIMIHPLNKDFIWPWSVDLTLWNEFRIFEKQLQVYHVNDDSRFEDVTKLVTISDGESIVINPWEMILGVTQEKITLSDNISGWLEWRSRFARFWLAIHVTAGFMNPGISNHQVLEIVNFGNTPMALYPWTRICQFVFERCIWHAQYKWRFSNQICP
jgi:dCTP deaminase